MKAKAFWLGLLLVILFSGCDSVSNQKLRYQPKEEISRQAVYNLEEATRHLDAIKRLDRDSHLHVLDFNLQVEEGQIDFQRFGLTKEKIDSLVKESLKLAIKADLADLRSLTFDGDYDAVVDHIHFCLYQLEAELYDFETTESELDNLAIDNKRALGRRVVAELRLHFAQGRQSRIDVQSYIDQIDSLAEELRVAVDIFGITSEELAEYSYLADVKEE